MPRLNFNFLFVGWLFCLILPLKGVHAQQVAADSLEFSVNKKVVDRWIAPDKGLHFLGSMMITVATAKTLQQHFNFEKKKGQQWAVGFTLALGVGKEWRDARQENNFFSWKDLMADCLGTALGRLLLEIK